MNSSRIKEDDHECPVSDTSDVTSDAPDSDLAIHMSSKSPSGLSPALSLKSTSPPIPSVTPLSSQCQYLGGPKAYSQSCMANDQYYPHHSAVNRSAGSSFMPVSTTSSLLQPTSSSLSLSGIHGVNQQMAPCRLSAPPSSDCALRQPSGHLPSGSHSYGLHRTSPHQLPSLPSCTYMQPSQAYASHISPNVQHMMNMNFPGPMAWTMNSDLWHSHSYLVRSLETRNRLVLSLATETRIQLVLAEFGPSSYPMGPTMYKLIYYMVYNTLHLPNPCVYILIIN